MRSTQEILKEIHDAMDQIDQLKQKRRELSEEFDRAQNEEMAARDKK